MTSTAKRKLEVISISLLVCVMAGAAYFGYARWLKSHRLAEAGARGDWNYVRSAVEDHANPNVEDRFGRSPLLNAAESNQTEEIMLLLERGANPNVSVPGPGFDWTPLMWSAHHCNHRMAKALLEHGASVNVQSGRGESALVFAMRSECSPVALTLLTNGANPNLTDIEGRTALHSAAIWGWSEGARLLLEHGAERNVKDDHGKTALHYARHPNPRYVEGARLKDAQDLAELLSE